MGGFGLADLKTRIEIPVVLTLFSMFLQASVSTNLVVYRTCYVNLGYNESDCALLGTGTTEKSINILEKKVEPYANVVGLFIQLPVGVICAFVALFVGSWSDRNGRKKVLIYTMAAQGLQSAIVAIICLIPGLSSWYILVSQIPLVLTGGFAAMLTTFLSYITDTSDEKSRGLRLGIFEALFSFGLLSGTFSSSYMFNAIGYFGVFAVGSLCFLIALIFTSFILEESLSESHIESCSQDEQPPFSAQLKEMARSAFRKRPSYERSIILLCVVITSLFIFAILSDSGILYLFLRRKFEWSLQQFTIYSSLRELLTIFGTGIGVYGLHKKCDVDEGVLILMGLIAVFGSSMVQGLAISSDDIYFAGVLRCFAGTVNPMIRSLISKYAKPDEIGKIFAVAVMCQSIFQLIGSPVYTEIYNRTLSSCPSLFNFVTAGIYFVAIISTIAMIILRRKTAGSAQYDILPEDAVGPSGSINEEIENSQRSNTAN